MWENSSIPCDYSFKMTFQIAYIALPLNFLIICENILIVATVRRTPALHNNQNIFMVSLALADVLLCLSYMTNTCVHIWWRRSAQLKTNIIDSFVFGTTYSSVALTGLHMGIIAVDRYIYIAHPFCYIQKLTKRRIFQILLCAWVAGIIHIIIPITVYTDDKYHIKCINEHPPVEYFCVFSTLLIVNFVVVVVCYFRIAIVAFRHKKNAATRRLRTAEIGSDAIFRDNRAAVMKSVRFFVTVCGVYFFCCIPPLSVIMMNYFIKVPRFVNMIAAYVYPLHSPLNFIINCSMNHHFLAGIKRACTDLITCCCRHPRNQL